MMWLKMVLVSVLSALAVQAFDGVVNPPRRFARVDVMLVLQEHIDLMATSKADGVITTAPEALSHRIEQVVSEMVEEYGVTMLVSQAVVTDNIPDLTDELRQRVEKRWIK